MIYLIAILTMLPSLAWAGNLNIPTIILTERLMIYSFAFIVALEALVIYKYLPVLSKKKALFISLKSNLITILLVMPFVWGIWCAILFNLPQIITSFLDTLMVENIIAPIFDNVIITYIFIAPWVNESQSLLLAEWIMVPVYFISSYYIEYWFSYKKLKEFDRSKVKKAFFYANLYSYLMIMAFETIYQIIIIPYKITNPYLF